MSNIIYSSTSGKGPIIDLECRRVNDDIMIKLKGIKQFVIIYEFAKKQTEIYELDPPDGSDTITIDTLFSKAKDHPVGWSDKTFYYIYNVRTRKLAEEYASLFPYDDPKPSGIKLGHGKKNGLKWISTASGYYGIHNSKGDIYIKDPYASPQQGAVSDLIKLPGNKTTYKQLTFSPEQAIIRNSLSPMGVDYRSLTYDERQSYVPVCVERGVFTIKDSCLSDWIDSNKCIYTGTLTYRETRDKDLHFTDDQGHSFRYGIDLARKLIPFMNNGSVTGSFRYVPRGNRNLSYVPVPINNNNKTVVVEGEFELADDSDSDSDPDSESD